MIYFDNSSTTKPYPEVLESYTTVSNQFFANPSSLHRLGGTAENLLNRARKQAADLLGVRESEVIFTSGGTEGNNLAIKGAALYYRNRGNHVITTEVEHASTYEAFKQLENLGFDVTYLRPDMYGCISLDDVKGALRDDTILISLIHVNNELGSVQPLEDISQLIKERPKTLLHIDHVQGIGKVPINIKSLAIDFCTISGHKFHGPKGIGILYIKDGVHLSPLLSGGGQEQARRSGTENLPAVVGMVKALRMSLEKSINGISRMASLIELLRSELGRNPSIVIHTPKKNAAPHILNFSVMNIKPEVMIHTLEKHDIYISTKSACSSKQSDISRVLLACGISKQVASSSLRISLSYENTKEEVESFLNIFNESMTNLQKVMG